MIPKTKPRPKRKDFKFYDQYAAAVMAWKKSKPKAGATKTTKTRKGSKYITTTLVWNGSRWVKKSDSSLVPSRAGKNEGNTSENKKLKIKAQYEKDKKIPKIKPNNGSGNGGTSNNGGSSNNGESSNKGGTSDKGENKKVTPKYKKVTQKELDAKLAEKKKGKETLKVKPKKMHAIEKRNRERFGDAHVDKLKARYAKFKADRKKKMFKRKGSQSILEDNRMFKDRGPPSIELVQQFTRVTDT